MNLSTFKCVTALGPSIRHRRRRGRTEDRPRKRSRRARSGPVAHLRRPHRLHGAVRQAGRRRAGSADRSAARDRMEVVRRRQGTEHEAARRRQVPRWRRPSTPRPSTPTSTRNAPCRSRAARARSPRSTRSRSATLEVKFKLKQRRRDAAGAALRPRRHDRLAQGRQGARRQFRQQAGLRRPVQIRRAGTAGPHRAGEVSRTTGTRTTIFIDKVTYLPIPDTTVRLANLRVRRSRHASNGWRRPTSAGVKADANLTIADAVNLGYHGTQHQCRQRRARRQSARQGQARAPGFLAGARPRRHQPGRLSRAPHTPATSPSRRRAPGSTRMSRCRRAMSRRPRR